MSQSSSSSSAPLPPPGTNYLATIEPSYALAMGVTPFCACLVPILAVLFVLSTPATRRRLVFRLNVLAICIAIVTGTLSGVVNSNAILYPLEPNSYGLFVAATVFGLLPPLFYDSILLLRLLAFYPISSTPALMLAKVLAFPTTVKVGRLTMLALYFYFYTRKSPSHVSVQLYAAANWFRNPYITAEWTLQMFDNLYSCGFFLYKLYQHNSRVFSIRTPNRLSECIRQVFFISAANFVFPVIFNIAQIICITSNRSFATGTLLMFINGYVSLIGVLSATIWFAGTMWAKEQNGSNASDSANTAVLRQDKLRRSLGQRQHSRAGSNAYALDTVDADSSAEYRRQFGYGVAMKAERETSQDSALYKV